MDPLGVDNDFIIMPITSKDFSESDYEFVIKSLNDVMEMFNLSCLAVQDLYPDYVDGLALKIVFGIAYFCVLVCGVCGNLLTAYCVLALRVNVGINAAFVLSFVCSNLAIALLSLPFTAQHIFAREWLLGNALCKLVPFFQMTGTFVCSFTLSAIAVDRYRNVVYHRVQQNRGIQFGPHLFVVMALWAVALGISFPYAYGIMNIVTYEKLCGEFCEEVWPSDLYKRSTSFAIVVVQFVLPMVILGYCYGYLRRTISLLSIAEVQNMNSLNRTTMFSMSIRRREKYSLTQGGHQKLRRTRSKTSTLTTLLCAAFVGPWLPFNLLHIIRDFTVMPLEYDLIAFAIVYLTAMTSTMWNPLIYCGLNRDFRSAVASCLHCRKIAHKAFISEYNRSQCPNNSKKPSDCSMIVYDLGVDVDRSCISANVV